MDKEKKNRSGSQSNRHGKSENTGDRHRNSLPGAPAKSNRQTKGRDTRGPEKESGEKKQSNAI
jgi:hypothetical protein